MREAVEVVDFASWRLTAHSGIPAVEGLDQTDHAATGQAIEGAIGVVSVVGQEMRIAGRSV